MNIFKNRILHGLNYLPGAVVLIVSLFALNASLVVTKENKILQNLYEESFPQNAENALKIIEAKDIIAEKDSWLYWSVWVLGLSGFVLVLMNADKLRRLKSANVEKEESLQLMEKQLEGIQKAEKDKAALQEQLHQAQKLEAVGRLAGGIAHDFNNILAAMNGYAEFLIDDLEPETPQQGFAENILKAGKQARELVDKILAFSRRDHDETQKIRLVDSVHETLSMLKASLPKTVDVHIDMQDEEYAMYGSPTLISQALMNLCVNAKDAMPNEKGTLMISLSLADMSYFEDMDVSDELPATDNLPLVDIQDISPVHTCLSMGKIVKDQDYMCLSVADDGSGMSRVIMENIFEPFFTTKPVDKGTGLGLAMVHGVIASHSGAMQINSIAGKGTRFDLLFPTIGEVTEIVDEKSVKDGWKAVGNILLVDDQDDVRMMTQTMLERLGFEVESCEGGVAALEILREHPDYFSVVVTDQNMPKITGLDLVERVSAEHPEIPFVLVTGYSLEKLNDAMEKYESLKAVVKKPIDREKLAEAVQLASLERQFAA